MLHDSEIPLLVSYTRSIFVYVLQENAHISIICHSKTKQNWKEAEDSKSKMDQKKYCLFIEQKNTGININEV